MVEQANDWGWMVKALQKKTVIHAIQGKWPTQKLHYRDFMVS